MLLRAPDSDAADLAFAEWRAKLPFWNIEADRFRAAAIEACRSGVASPGIIDDIEGTLIQIRSALHRCDALTDAALPGDHQLTRLIKAAADFEALLESLHRSRERIEDLGGSAPSTGRPVTIAHRPSPPPR
jgi:hypothetical protein